METVRQCGRCGARESAPHVDGCIGRKVKVKVYSRLDFKSAEESQFVRRPDTIRCLDNGGKTFDRYLIVRTTPASFDPSRGCGTYCQIDASPNPYHPQGVGIVSETLYGPLWGIGQYASRAGEQFRRAGYSPIRWRQLPLPVRKLAWELVIDD